MITSKEKNGNDQNEKTEKKGKARRISKQEEKAVNDSSDSSSSSSSENEEDSDEELRKKLVEIEEVCNSMIGESGYLEYEVKWKGLPEDFRTWETRDDMEEANIIGLELVDQFDLSDRKSRKAVKEEANFIRSSKEKEPVKKRVYERKILNSGEDRKRSRSPRKEVRTKKRIKVDDMLEDEQEISKISDSEESLEFSDDEVSSFGNGKVLDSSKVELQVSDNLVPRKMEENLEEHEHIDLDMDGWASLLNNQDETTFPILKNSPESIKPLSGAFEKSPPLSSLSGKQTISIPNLSFQVEMPVRIESFSIELVQKVSVMPSLFIGSSSVPLEARYVPQSVRNYLMNNGQVEQYRFDFKGESKSFDSLSSLAFSLTGIVCKTCKETSERLFLFPVKSSKTSLYLIGVIFKWEVIEKISSDIFCDTLDRVKKMHLVLDLDSTLIWALSVKNIDEKAKSRCFNISSNLYDMYVQFRPGVDVFLHEASKMFEISIYTAAELEYAKELIRKANHLGWSITPNESLPTIDWNEIVPISRIYSSGKEFSSVPNMKDLQNAYLFYQYIHMRNSVVIVDDNISSWIEENRGHIYVVPPFTGDETDTGLTACLEYLKSIYREFFMTRHISKPLSIRYF